MKAVYFCHCTWKSLVQWYTYISLEYSLLARREWRELKPRDAAMYFLEFCFFEGGGGGNLVGRTKRKTDYSQSNISMTIWSLFQQVTYLLTELK